jgi:hypothetical protein
MASYLEIAGLRTNDDFKARVMVAVIKYAAYVQNEDSGIPFHELRVTWARRALLNPEEQAFRIMGTLIGNGTIQAQLGGIPDADLQSAVEYAINTQMPVLI